MTFKKIYFSLFLFFFSINLTFWQLAALGRTAIADQSQKKSLCPNQLGASIDAVIDRPEFTRARWGILVESRSSARNLEKTLYNRDGSKYFIPASNAKLLTTATALQQLGASFRFRTSIYQDADDVLVVRGEGDPSLTDIQLRELAKQLRQRGKTQIKQLILDDSYIQGDIVHSSWEWEDIESDYGAPVGSFILNENTFGLQLLPSTVGNAPRVIWNDPDEASNWRTINQAVTAGANQPTYINISRDLSGNVLHIKGQIAASSPPYLTNLPITEPNRYFLDHLKQALAAEHITVEKTSIVSGGNHQREIAYIESLPLAEMLSYTNHQSDNLYAEAILRALGGNQAQDSNALALEVVKHNLTQLGVVPESYTLFDGSGLSRKDLISPEAIVETLRGMAKTPNAFVYRDSLPLAGKSGTLKNRFQQISTQAIVRAKTGSMTGVSALSGYIESSDYQPLVFSIMVNDVNQPVGIVRQAIDQVVVLLTQLKSCQVELSN